MTNENLDVFSDHYWENQFGITQEDLNRIIERLKRDGFPQDLKSIALRLIRGRLEHGPDLSPAVLQKWTGKAYVRLWDPEGDWKLGDIVLIPHCPKGADNHELFLGEIIEINQDSVKFRVEGLSETPSFIWCSPKNPKGKNYSPEKWRDFIRNLVQEKYRSVDLSKYSEGILLKYGERILNHLTEVLQQDTRFVELEGKWYVKQGLPKVPDRLIKEIYRILKEKPENSLDEISESISLPDKRIDRSLWCMAIHIALQSHPQQFENFGTPSHPKWRTRPPRPNQASALYYVYDPETFEIICIPKQRLNLKQVHRLQELKLYDKVVEFSE